MKRESVHQWLSDKQACVNSFLSEVICFFLINEKIVKSVLKY